ncbi:MAG TPA: hypothetical protein VFH73_05750 [Polyangia bacterium]|jgi:hypothetical protein|nr:hypothetical protein [Polyangia bacterium]
MSKSTSAASSLESTTTLPATALRIDQETFGQAREVADGFWIIATRHRPGLSKHMFEINNRCVVFRLFDSAAGANCLVVVNAVDPTDAIPQVRRLERETGLGVRYIISPGGGHHLHVDPWYAAFAGAKVLLGPVRVPQTAHGKKLIQLPRVELMNIDDPLPQFRGQLDAVLFHGLVGPADSRTPGDGGPDTIGSMLKGMLHLMRSRAPADELWLYHVASGTVIAGENLAWYYPRAALRKQPFMARGMLKPDKVWIWTVARKVGDAQTVAACWRRILAWPAKTVMTYHDVVGTAITSDSRAALADAVKQSGQLDA